MSDGVELIVSPTEPKELRDLGRVHLFPEAYGCDVLVPSVGDWVGVQRKEVSDLVASMVDGRLAEQVGKMQGLERRVVLVEGVVPWNRQGCWKPDFGPMVRWEDLEMLLWGVEERGVCVVRTQRLLGPCSTVGWLEALKRREAKGHHRALDGTRGRVKAKWGTADSEDYQRHLLMGLPGMGPETAQRILDEIGMPLTWKEGVDLESVKGVGAKKVAAWKKAVE